MGAVKMGEAAAPSVVPTVAPIMQALLLTRWLLVTRLLLRLTRSMLLTRRWLTWLLVLLLMRLRRLWRLLRRWHLPVQQGLQTGASPLGSGEQDAVPWPLTRRSKV